MSDAFTPDPPPVPETPYEEPRREPLPDTVFPKAHPGFWSALGWGLVLSIGPQVIGGVAAAVALVAFIIANQGNPALQGGNMDAILEIPFVSYVVAGTIWLSHSLIVVAALLALRVVIGRDWARQVAFRLPAWWQAFVIVLIGPAVQVAAAAAVYGLQLAGVPSFKDVVSSVAFLASVFAALLVFGLGSLVFYRPKPVPHGTSTAAGGLARTLAVVVPFVALTGVTFYLLGDAAKKAFPDVQPGTDMGAVERMLRDWPLWLGIAVIAVMPAVSEELLCRAFLGRGLVGLHGPVLGVALTSFLFGLIHMDPLQGSMAMVLGMLIHFAYLTTRSIFIPMLLHFMNNGLAVVLSKVRELREAAEKIEAAPGGGLDPKVELLFVAAWATVVAAGVLLYAGRTRLTTPPGEPAWEPAFEGVELPPPSSFTEATTPAPPWWAVGVFAAALAGFVAAGWRMFD